MNNNLLNINEIDGNLILDDGAPIPPSFIDTPKINVYYNTLQFSARLDLGTLEGKTALICEIDDLNIGLRFADLTRLSDTDFYTCTFTLTKQLEPETSHLFSIKLVKFTDKLMDDNTLEAYEKGYNQLSTYIGQYEFAELTNLSFTVLQSFPELVSDLAIKIEKAEDESDRLIVEFTKPLSWGYWDKNEKGYVLSIWQSNNKIKSLYLSSTSNNTKEKFSLTLPDFIKKDIDSAILLRVGVQTRVITNAGTPLLSVTEIFSNQINFKIKPENFYLAKLFLKTKNNKFTRISLIDNLKRGN